MSKIYSSKKKVHPYQSFIVITHPVNPRFYVLKFCDYNTVNLKLIKLNKFVVSN